MQFQAIVIGGGVVGLNAAWCLLERGLKHVLIVERDLLASGGTGLGTGSVHTQRWHPTDTALVLRSRDLMRQVSERTGGAFRLFPVGRLTLAGTADEAAVQAYGRHLREAGVDAAELSRDRLAEQFPGMNVSDAALGLYTSGDGVIYPSALAWALAGLFRNAGGSIWEGCGVRRILHDHGAVRGIEIANGDTILGERVIACAGLWTKQLLEASGLKLALRHVIAHNTVVTVADENRWPCIPSLLDAIQGVIAIPRNPGTIMASNSSGEYQADDATVEAVAKASSVHVRRRDAAFAEKSSSLQKQILEQLRRRYGQGIRGVVGHWTGLLDATPDSHPYVGRYPGLDALWIGCGLGGYGVQRGPGVGEALANLALDRPLPAAVDGYRLDRLDLTQDFQIDLSRDNPFAGFKPDRKVPAMLPAH